MNIAYILYLLKTDTTAKDEKQFNWYFKRDLFMHSVFSRQCFIQVNVHVNDLES